MKTNILFVLLLTLLTSLLSPHVHAADSILHNFTGGSSDGLNPSGSLTLTGSTIYGTSEYGGSSNSGAIFIMNTDGSGFSLLHSFTGGSSDGAIPLGTLTLSNSTFYGTTNNGGGSNNGTVFSLNTNGSGFSVLHSFTGGSSDGQIPGGIVTLSGSTLYGMTASGGSGNTGTLFSMNTNGSGYSLLHNFIGGNSDGSDPEGSLTLSGSTLYGMTFGGGGSSKGTIFSINTDGTGFSLLRSFVGGGSDGANPIASLTLSGSTLYGMTRFGGSSNVGTIFSMNTNGTGFSLLHTFNGGSNDGSRSRSSLTLNGSTLYGMTEQGGTNNVGTLFRINTDGSGFNLLQSFAGATADGADPWADATLSDDGSTLFGTTALGGSGNATFGGGVVFSVSVPEPSTWAMLTAGTASLLALRRRKRN